MVRSGRQDRSWGVTALAGFAAMAVATLSPLAMTAAGATTFLSDTNGNTVLDAQTNGGRQVEGSQIYYYAGCGPYALAREWTGDGSDPYQSTVYDYVGDICWAGDHLVAVYGSFSTFGRTSLYGVAGIMTGYPVNDTVYWFGTAYVVIDG